MLISTKCPSYLKDISALMYIVCVYSCFKGYISALHLSTSLFAKFSSLIGIGLLVAF